MKIVRSRRAEVTVTVPLHGGFRVRFEAGRAVVPDDVAAHLVGLTGGFYLGAEKLGEALCPGASVLVIRDTGAGDVLMTTPLLRRLAAQGCVVNVLTHARYIPLFDSNTAVRAVRALETDDRDRRGYDVVLDLRLVVENAEAAGIFEHRADAFARMAGISLTPAERTPDYYVRPDEIAAAISQIGAFPEGRRIAYAWESSTSNRNWSRTTHEAVLSALVAAHYAVVVLDTKVQDLPVEKWGGAVRDLTGCLTLREAAAVLHGCDAVITPDTGLFHLAGALAMPTVAYFGAFPAQERQAHTHLTVLSQSENCGKLPCRSYRCFNRDADGQARCLSLDPAEIVQAVSVLLTAANEGIPADATGMERLADDRLAPSPVGDGNGECAGGAAAGLVFDCPSGDSSADPAA